MINRNAPCGPSSPASQHIASIAQKTLRGRLSKLSVSFPQWDVRTEAHGCLILEPAVLDDRAGEVLA